jgi:hypothetical protein
MSAGKPKKTKTKKKFKAEAVAGPAGIAVGSSPYNKSAVTRSSFKSLTHPA